MEMTVVDSLMSLRRGNMFHQFPVSAYELVAPLIIRFVLLMITSTYLPIFKYVKKKKIK